MFSSTPAATDIGDLGGELRLTTVGVYGHGDFVWFSRVGSDTSAFVGELVDTRSGDFCGLLVGGKPAGSFAGLLSWGTTTICFSARDSPYFGEEEAWWTDLYSLWSGTTQM
ncbi:hypothetical protein ZOSMA_95G00090 [Zostera marina]|uniref:Uncharacterized protein n=1 Tax=Zostera marina TaxID=29655 RepID=A0A0K9NKB4_ZOSMR|nr:hypothetical protein ZOSMA_95G00090 [Zostera marina]